MLSIARAQPVSHHHHHHHHPGPMTKAQRSPQASSSTTAAPTPPDASPATPAFASLSSSTSPPDQPHPPIVSFPSPIRPTFTKESSLRTRQASNKPITGNKSHSTGALRQQAHGSSPRPSHPPRRNVTFDAPSRGTTPHPPGFMPLFQRDASDATVGPPTKPDLEPTSEVVDYPGQGSATLPDVQQSALSKQSNQLHASPSTSLQAIQLKQENFDSENLPPKSRQSSMSFGDCDATTLDYTAGPRNGVTASTSGRGQRKKKRPAPPELLVIVRPPPSKDRNPLNLQIQLVVPTATPNATSRTSGESSRDVSSSPGPPSAPSSVGHSGSTTLQRRGSSGSSLSSRSEVTTASTNSGVGSTSRKVTPLYNLSVHSILPTTVSDAGTDQRVAKYSKKGLVEIDDFAVLEPRELVRSVNDLATLESSGAVCINAETSSDTSATSPANETTDSGVAFQNVEPPTSFEAMTPEARSPELTGTGTKILKRFKGLSFGGPKGGERPASSVGGSTSGVGAFLSSLGSQGPKSVKGSTSDSARPVSVAGLSLVSGLSAATAAKSSGSKPGADLSPLVPGAGLNEHGGRRSHGYVWTFAKMTRKVTDEEGNLPEAPLDVEGQNQVLRNVWRHFNTVNKLGGDEKHPHPQRIPIRFEWTRESRQGSFSGPQSSGRQRSGAGHSSAKVNSKRLSVQSYASGTASAENSGITVPEATEATTSRPSLRLPVPDRHLRPGDSRSRSRDDSNAASPRQSMDTRSQKGGSATSHGDEDEDLSDPEDSETIWSCHLVLDPNTRIPIGTLSPAPHHPKIVAQLAVPFPLPDLSQTGLCTDGAGLSREEIKDVICVSALHLILRESFGGLGSLRRKKDRN